MLQQISSGLYGQRVDRPRLSVVAQKADDGFAGCHISQPEPRNAILLGHRVEQHHVGLLHRVGIVEQRAKGIVLVGLVDHVEGIVGKRELQDGARGVVGIADEMEFPGALAAGCGTGILAEGRLVDHRPAVAEGLGNEIDGLGGTIGHHHVVGTDAHPLGQHALKGVRLGLGIAGNDVEA